MLRMFIFTYYEDLHKVFGPINVRFTKTEDEFARAIIDSDYALSRNDFAGGIPTCSLVEMYVKRSDLEQPGPHGNDWVFVNSWQAPFSRERATERYYQAVRHVKEI